MTQLQRLALIICGLSAAAALGFGLAIFFSRMSRPPPLTHAAFTAAQARWEQFAPRDYRLSVQVTGQQHGSYVLLVRAGQPISATRNGQELRRHTWDYWTVPGLFKIIDIDLSGLDDAEQHFQAPPGATIELQAEFDSQLGYPARYRRAVLETGMETAWQVTEFAVENREK